MIATVSPARREAFDELIAAAGPTLRLHCYRIVGSLDDAEDLVQETLVRAWRHRERLVDLEGLRPWLYRIATNACLDFLDRQRRRPTSSLDDVPAWPDPVPDGWLEPISGGDPADVAIRREAISLAFLTAVQRLPPRQRAMLVLRDVLEWPASDVAEALETTVSAVHSGVRRARSAIRAGSPPRAPAAEAAVSVARRYADAWERTDIAGLADLLASDARMAMPPDPHQFVSRAAITDYFASILGQPRERRIRLDPTWANGQPAFIVTAPDAATGALVRIGLKVLILRGELIAEIRGYMRADLAARFDAHA